MFFGKLNNPEQYGIATDHDVWKKAFGWLKAAAANMPVDGEI